MIHIFKPQKEVGFYRVNGKPILIENLDLHKLGSQFTVCEIRALEDFIKSEQ